MIFCTQTSLSPGLNTLGYPNTDLDDLYLPDGHISATLLEFLAEKIEPSAEVSIVGTIVSFWDGMGVYS